MMAKFINPQRACARVVLSFIKHSRRRLTFSPLAKS